MNVPNESLTSPLQILAAAAKQFSADSRAPNTRRAYQSDWREWRWFAEQHGLPAMPAAPEHLALFIVQMDKDGLTPTTIKRRLGSISVAHKTAGQEPNPVQHPTVQAVWQGLQRARQYRPVAKLALGLRELRAMLATCPDTVTGMRDRAILLLGFSSSLRRSELVALQRADVTELGGGLALRIRRSKTDQAGNGRTVGIPAGERFATCPVMAVHNWLAISRITKGPLFRSVDRHERVSAEGLTSQSVALIVKRRAEAAGLDPAVYSGHSLRAGFVTAALAGGASEADVMKQTGHVKTSTMRGYYQPAAVGAESAGRKLGL